MDGLQAFAIMVLSASMAAFLTGVIVDSRGDGLVLSQCEKVGAIVVRGTVIKCTPVKGSLGTAQEK